MLKIKTNSKEIKKNDTFVAIKGKYRDGHDYIEEAIKNGATKIVAEHGKYSVTTEIVKDTKKYLNDYLYKNYKNILDEIKIIGITGTNGKTTSCFLIYQALNKLKIPCAYIGTIGFYLNKKVKNLNNTSVDIITLYELILEAYNKGYKHIVLEVSSQGLLEERFSHITFDIAVFTNLTQDHLDIHKTMTKYRNTKLELFKKLKPTGLAIINNDDKYKNFYSLKENTNITYGFSNSNYQIIDFKINKDNSKFTYKYQDKKYKLLVKLIGKYNLYNLLVCLSTLHELGIPLSKINKIMPKLTSPEGRVDKIKYKKNSIIIDYAHTPDALKKILELSKNITKNNIYVIFGCTGNRDKTKRPIMTKIVLENCNYAIITNDDPHHEDAKSIVKDMLKKNKYNNYKICLDRKKAIRLGIDMLKEDDTLLILGKGHEKYMYIKDLKVPFNDKEEVLRYLKRKK